MKVTPVVPTLPSRGLYIGLRREVAPYKSEQPERAPSKEERTVPMAPERGKIVNILV